jgi:hypothetical protein
MSCQMLHVDSIMTLTGNPTMRAKTRVFLKPTSTDLHGKSSERHVQKQDLHSMGKHKPY